MHINVYNELLICKFKLQGSMCNYSESFNSYRYYDCFLNCLV